jgi:type II secretory pathway pseudopilin PulG
VALVVSLLMVVVLLGVLMAITSTLSLSSRRITGDQRATQQAQFAAESGVAQVRARLKETFALINNMSVPQSVTDATLEAAITNFCDGTALTAGNSVPDPLVTTGSGTCTSSLSTVGMNKFVLFTSYITSGYPTGVVASDYWRDVFYDGGGTPKQVQQVISTAGGASTRYTLTGYGLIPRGAKRLGPSLYEIDFRLAVPLLAGEIVVGNNAVSTRKMQLSMPSTVYTLTISRPSYAQYVLFRNKTTATNGNQLYFRNNEVFNGPVHTNGTPAFSGATGPTFTDKFTSAASGPTIDSTNATFTTTPANYGLATIALPTNSNNQVRASFGGNAADASAVSASELQTAWGVSTMATGIYYTQGNGTTKPNTGSSWKGGLYIQGNVDSLTLSKSGAFQVITVVQGATTTVLTQQSNGTWSVAVNGAVIKTISATPAFNGMIYVAGGVTGLGGDGTGAADIASGSQITLSTTGDVNIKKDITYTDDPTTNPNATNVLGIFSSGGSILLDGPSNQSLNVNASIMASGNGKGFGTANVNSRAGSPSTKINLLGGVIEDQSQTVSLGEPITNGYNRNYSYDPRFRLGFAPPYFPLQQQWSASAVDFSNPKIVWEPKAN